MATNLKAPNPIQIKLVEWFQNEIQALCFGQYDFLSEVVGLIFGTMTLGWIITSLSALP
jgi:hypothetical protein